MNSGERIAFCNSQVACALIEMESMKAENDRQKHLGCAPFYLEEDFKNLITKYGIDHNGVALFFFWGGVRGE